MFEEVVVELFRAGIIRFGDFVLSSGKRSPYYFDFRVLPSYPETYSRVIDLWVRVLVSAGVAFDCVVGIASAGIAHAAVLGYLMKKPVGYVRVERKDHGTGRLVEGLVRGRVLIVDDVATTGGTLARACSAVREVGAWASAFTVILDREEGAEAVSRDLGVSFLPLMRASQVFKTLRDLGVIGEELYSKAASYLGGNRRDTG